eukprot:8873517-Pyramimonas_sp.AAC.1
MRAQLYQGLEARRAAVEQELAEKTEQLAADVAFVEEEEAAAARLEEEMMAEVDARAQKRGEAKRAAAEARAADRLLAKQAHVQEKVHNLVKTEFETFVLGSYT